MSTLGDVADVNPVIKFLSHKVKSRGIGGKYVPPMPHDLPQLRRRIMEAVAAIDGQMFQCVWKELDYRIDICYVTKGGHIEHL
jgi:hypothetical protein